MTNNPYGSPRYASASGPDQPLKVPAILLLALAALSLLLLVLSAGVDVWLLSSDLPEQMHDPEALDVSKRASIQIRLAWGIALIICNAITVAGAVAMLRMGSFGLAKTGAIISVIPCCGPCFVLGLPFGIWALIVMHKPEVRQQFES